MTSPLWQVQLATTVDRPGSDWCPVDRPMGDRVWVKRAKWKCLSNRQTMADDFGVVVYKTRSFLDKSCLSPMGLRLDRHCSAVSTCGKSLTADNVSPRNFLVEIFPSTKVFQPVSFGMTANSVWDSVRFSSIHWDSMQCCPQCEFEAQWLESSHWMSSAGVLSFPASASLAHYEQMSIEYWRTECTLDQKIGVQRV